MYKTIIVPIDLAHAEKGKGMIEVARTLGGKSARIILVSIVEDIPVYVSSELPKGLLDKIGDNAQADLEAMAKAAGVNAEIIVRSGHPSTAIIAVSEETDADIILIASHRPGWQDYLLGSTAARVVRHAKCSVLVMR